MKVEREDSAYVCHVYKHTDLLSLLKYDSRKELMKFLK